MVLGGDKEQLQSLDQLHTVEGDVGQVEEYTLHHRDGDVGDDHTGPGGED